jgi:hypothetical protein
MAFPCITWMMRVWSTSMSSTGWVWTFIVVLQAVSLDIYCGSTGSQSGHLLWSYRRSVVDIYCGFIGGQSGHLLWSYRHLLWSYRRSVWTFIVVLQAVSLGHLLWSYRRSVWTFIVVLQAVSLDIYCAPTGIYCGPTGGQSWTFIVVLQAVSLGHLLWSYRRSVLDITKPLFYNMNQSLKSTHSLLLHYSAMLRVLIKICKAVGKKYLDTLYSIWCHN